MASETSGASPSLDALLRAVARTPDERPPAEGLLAGRFEILRLVGQGAFGAVYQARDTQLGRHVAVKLVQPWRVERGGSDVLERFHREAHAAARLNHPNVVTLHDFGVADGVPYLVLELLVGETLALRLARGPIAPPEAVELLGAVCRGVAHAHAAGLIHRDLKPTNIFLGERGQVKVLDFGLVRMDGAPSGGGTPAYMAPEQRRGEPEDERTDVYALGVTLCELLCGRNPFSVAQLEQGDLEAGLATVRRIDAHLADVAARALARDPTDRHVDAMELLRALAARAESGEPYRFLEHFTEADAAWFFGRQTEAARLARRVAAHPVTAVTGASGAGKSSLLRAGLVPRLRRGGEWLTLELRPGDDPLGRLGARLGQLGGEPVGELRDGPGLAGRLLRRHAAATRQSILLMIDPLEELATERVPVEARRAFVRALLGAADDADGPVRLVLVLRDDLIGRLLEIAELRDALAENLFVLGRPDSEALVETLQGPARRLGVEYETGLAEEMVAAVAGEAAPLPILELAASRLWERRDPSARQLSRRDLERAGGVVGILAAHAEDVMATVADDRLVRRLLLGLVHGAGTRRRMPRDDLLARAGSGAAPVLERLISGRLVSAFRADGVEWVELAHESLLAGWTRLREWLEERRADEQLAARVAEAAARWRARGRPRELLWRGDALAAALGWRDRQDELDEERRTFLSRSLARERRARGTRRSALLATLLTAAAAVTIFVAMRALADARRAARVRELVAAARDSSDPLTGALLLVELQGEEEPPGGLAAAVAIGAHAIPSFEYRFDGVGSSVASWSPDGERIVTATRRDTSPAGRAAEGPIGRADGRGDPIVLRDSMGTIFDARFSPDGTRVVTASLDEVGGRIFGADGRLARRLRHPTGAQRAWFDASGEKVLTWSGGGSLGFLWVPPAFAEPRVFTPVTADGFQISGDGRIAIAGITGLGLYRADGTPIAFRAAYAETIGFTATGLYSLEWTWGGRRMLRLWTADLDEPRVLPGVSAVAADAGGRTLLVATRDGLAILDPDGGSPIPLQTGGEIDLLAISPDGSRALVTARGAARLLRTDGAGEPLVLEHAGFRMVARFSPDGSRVVSVQSSSARVWSTGDPPGIRSFSRPGARLRTIAISPDDASLAATTDDGKVLVWSVAGG